jgi:hypothetical protein
MTGPESAQALEKLHDVVLPPPVSMTPQTAGWYVLFALAGLLLLVTCVALARKRLRNRYRREALRELAALEAGAGDGAARNAALRALPGLLRRTALAVWPRDEVAPLSGDAWLTFLDRTYGGDGFAKGPGKLVALAAYEPDRDLAGIGEKDAREAFALAGEWIRRHRVRA